MIGSDDKLTPENDYELNDFRLIATGRVSDNNFCYVDVLGDYGVGSKPLDMGKAKQSFRLAVGNKGFDT